MIEQYGSQLADSLYVFKEESVGQIPIKEAVITCLGALRDATEDIQKSLKPFILARPSLQDGHM